MRRIFAVILIVLTLATVAFAITRTAKTPGEKSSANLPGAPAGDYTPATAAPIPTAGPTAVPTEEVLHSVASGDTLLDIAIRYDVEMEAIIAANEMENPDVLDVGQELIIPGIIIPTPVPLETLQAALLSGVEVVPKPIVVAVNNIPENDIIRFSEEARLLERETYVSGQELCRNPRAFTTAADSTTEITLFMGSIDDGPYNLGDYAYLQPVID